MNRAKVSTAVPHVELTEAEAKALAAICTSDSFKAATRNLLARLKRANAGVPLMYSTPGELTQAFRGEVAMLRAINAHNRKRGSVAAADVIDWLERKVRELQAAEAALLELVELPAAWPLGVKGWLMERAAARKRPELLLDVDRLAAQAHRVVFDYRLVFAEVLELAKANKPGRGRTKTAAARKPLRDALEALAERYSLDKAQRDTLLRIVFFDVAPSTVEPPAHIKKLRQK